jgi:succinate dehydrogenase/fumarate reductase flavoprotein subunit
MSNLENLCRLRGINKMTGISSKADVIVIGGGPAGFGVTVSASRNDIRTIVN